MALAFGQFDCWEAEFRRIANGLGGGSGWVVLGFNKQFGAAENYWMADHMHSRAMTVPLLVMDMYEHSYPIRRCILQQHPLGIRDRENRGHVTGIGEQR